MGNSRQFRPGRKARVESLKQRNRRLVAEAGYYRGLAEASDAQLQATKMERPEGLEEWIDSVLPDFSEEERAAWDSQTDEERETFIDGLGAQIRRTQAAEAIASGAADPSASETLD